MDVNDIDVAHHEYPDFCQIYQPQKFFRLRENGTSYKRLYSKVAWKGDDWKLGKKQSCVRKKCKLQKKGVWLECTKMINTNWKT